MYLVQFFFTHQSFWNLSLWQYVSWSKNCGFGFFRWIGCQTFCLSYVLQIILFLVKRLLDLRFSWSLYCGFLGLHPWIYFSFSYFWLSPFSNSSSLHHHHYRHVHHHSQHRLVYIYIISQVSLFRFEDRLLFVSRIVGSDRNILCSRYALEKKWFYTK